MTRHGRLGTIMNKMSADNFFISILICSRGRHAELTGLVQALRKMDTRHRFEIVVAEETPSPSPIEGVIYVAHPVLNKGIGFARNLALSRASGEIIAFLDDDCRICAHWLDELVAVFENSKVVGVQGGVTVPPTAGAVGWAESLLGFPGGGIRRVVQAGGVQQETREISTLNCAYRKSALDAVGGFDDRLVFGGEDDVLAKQVCDRGRCIFAPEAMITHMPRGSLAGIWKWFSRRGRADMDVVRMGNRHERTFFSAASSSLTVKLILLACLLGLFSTHAPVLLMAVLPAYLTLQYVRYSRSWRQSRAPFHALLVLPVVKIVMDAAMDWGRLRRI